MSDLAWLTARPIAHRGLHDMNKTRWENTLAAFDAAVEGDYAIECDVHLSADGVAMVFHDDELERLAGRPGSVHAHTAAELVQMQIGGTSERIPTLAEALTRIAGRVPVVIELKGAQGRDEGLVSAVAADLEGYPGKAAIMSFDHHLIRRFASEAPGIPGGLTAHGRTSADLEAHFSMLAHPIAFASFGVMDLPNPFVEMIRGKLGLPVITWTVRDQWAVELTAAHADQMTFEGFLP